MDILERLKQKYIKYNSTELLTCTKFCSNSTINCGDVSSIFNQNADTLAYATKEKLIDMKPFFSIEFLKFPIYLKSLKISTLCAEPKELIVEGSNGNGNWHTLSNITTLKSNSEATFQCENPGVFKIIRFRQIGANNQGTYRFHIYKINLYGELSKYNDCTRRISTRNIPSFIKYLIVLIVS